MRISTELRPDHRESARRIVEARLSTMDHARERPLRGKASRLEPTADARLSVGEINENGTVERGEHSGQQCARDRVVVRDKRSDLRGYAAVAAEHESDDATITAPRDNVGRSQTAAQTRQHRVAPGTKNRGIVGAELRPVAVGDRCDGDAVGRGDDVAFALRLTSPQAVETPDV